MNPAPMFDRVYGLIRNRLTQGDWRPGQRIDLPSLAAEMDASLTPLRDALHRLTGEGLLVTGYGDGFAVPSITEPELRDLYSWHLELVLLANRSRRRDARLEGIPQTDTLGEAADVAQRLFAALGDAGANPEHGRAIASAANRLHPVRRLEGRLFPDVLEELEGIRRSLMTGTGIEQIVLIKAYHRRRTRAAGQLAHWLYRPNG